MRANALRGIKLRTTTAFQRRMLCQHELTELPVWSRYHSGRRAVFTDLCSMADADLPCFQLLGLVPSNTSLSIRTMRTTEIVTELPILGSLYISDT